MEQQTNPQNDEFYQRALAALKKHNFAYAVELFQGVLKNYPDFTECRHHLFSAARTNKKANPPNLIQIFSEKINVFLLSLKVFYSSLANSLDQAIALQEKITLLIPDNIPALYKLATLFMQKNEPANAIVTLEEIFFINKSSPVALKLLARLYFKTENYQKAKTMARMLLDISPRDVEAENILKDIAAIGTIEKGFDELKPAT